MTRDIRAPKNEVVADEVMVALLPDISVVTVLKYRVA